MKSASARKTRSRIATDQRSFADSLFSGTQQKVLGLLFGQPDRSFFASEIINIAGSGSGAVQRELVRLEQSGLATTTRLGNQKHYQANRSAPIFEELTRIVLKTFGLADPIRQALEPLSQDIAWAIIYGSVAKKTDTASSDVDILIVGDSITLEEAFKALDQVEQQLHRKINPTVLSKTEFTRRSKAAQGFVSRVLGGEYLALMGSMDAAQATR